MIDLRIEIAIEISINHAAIIDRQFEAHSDLVVQQIRPPVNPIDFLAMPTVEELEHGNRVAGIFGATGDNSMGIAGMMWRSHLTLYALGAQGGISRNPYHDFLLHLVHINDTLGTRILRAETAAIAAISILQARMGELG